MIRRQSRANLAFNPWTWVLLATLVRLAALMGLFWGGQHARPTDMIPDPAGPRSYQRGPLDPDLSLIDFLRKRVYYSGLTEDEACYEMMARNLVAGRGFVLDLVYQITVPGRPAMYCGCAYPLFVAAIYRAFGPGDELPVFLAQALLHGLAAWFVVAAARRVAGPVAGMVAGLFYTLHPTLIWCSVAMLTEALVVPLVAALLWGLDPGLGRRLGDRPAGLVRAALLGALLAVLCLTRSTFAYFAAVAAVLMLALEPRRRRARGPAASGRVAVFLLAFAVVAAPWAARNYIHYHRFIPFSTKQGVNAYTFNHDGLRVEFGPGAFIGPAPVDLYGPVFAPLNEAERDRKCMELFRDFVRRHPAKFLGLCAVRFVIAVLPMSAVAESRTATLSAWLIKGPILVLLPLALVVGRRRLWWRTAPPVLFVAYYLAMQSMSGAGLRHRLSSDPAWAILAGIWCAVVMAAARPRPAAALRRARHWVARGRSRMPAA